MSNRARESALYEPNNAECVDAGGAGHELCSDESEASSESSGEANGAPVRRPKPRLRGVLHQYAFFASLIAGALLVASATHPRGRVAAAIYAVSLSALLGTSALYHRVHWTPRLRRWVGSLDHAMIFVLIAGTFTPFALLGLAGDSIATILLVAWGLAFGGAVLTVAWYDIPKAVSAILYVGISWCAAVLFPSLLDRLGGAGFAVIALGGVVYSAGAVVYGRQRPDPIPTVFGYHEVFHALVLAAAAIHFVGIAVFVPL